MASSVIGALRVNLGLDSAQFQNGLKRSQTGMQRFASQAKVAAAAAAAAMGVALAAMAKSGLSFVDSQAKAARSIDGTIDGLRALQIAAGDAGVDSGSLLSSMQLLGRRLDEATTKGGASADALKRIGLSAKDLMGMDADDRLAAIADKAKALGLNAQQTAGLLGEFGIRNKEMALLVMQGGDAIRAAGDEVKRLGLSLNEVDAAKVEAANDAWSRIALTTEALSNRLAVALAPAMQAIAAAFTAAMQEGGALRIVLDGLGDNIGRMTAYVTAFAAFMAGRFAVSVGVAAVGAVAGLTVSLAALRVALIRTGIGALIIGAGELILRFSRLVTATGGWGNALELLGEVAAGVWQGIKTSAKAIAPALGAVWQTVTAAFYSMLEGITLRWSRFLGNLGADLANVPGLSSFGESLLRSSGEALEGMSEFNALAQAATNSAARLTAQAASLATEGFDAARDAAARLRVAVADNTETTDDAVDTTNAFTDALEDAGASGRGGSAMDSLKEKISAVQERAKEMRDTLKDAFVDLVARGKSFGEVLKGLVAKMLEMAASRLFDNLFPANKTGGFAGGGGGGGFLGGLFKGILGFANGTPNFAGGLARINERGGEIVNLPNGSQVIPHQLSKNMMGGSTRIEIVNPVITATDDGQVMMKVEARVAQGMAATRKATLADVPGYMADHNRRRA